MKNKKGWEGLDRTGNGDGDHVIFSDKEYQLKIIVWESRKQIILILEKKDL
jgi:hypothetical protein